MSKEYICIESRKGFFKQVVRWILLHILSLLIAVLVYYYGVENELLVPQFHALILFLLFQGLMITFIDRILNVDGRLHDIYPGAPRFCKKHFGAIMLVPILSLAFIVFLCLRKRRDDHVPYFISHPNFFAEGALLIFLLTLITPLASLLWPGTIRWYGLNYGLATPGAYTVSQTVDRVQLIGQYARNPEVIEVTDLIHPSDEIYVSAMTFSLVKRKLMADMVQNRQRSIAGDDFEREIAYLRDLTELMKWADNSLTLFQYYHPAYVLPMSGWDTSLAMMAEQYFLYRSKYEVHREIKFYFEELLLSLPEGERKQKLILMKAEYEALTAVRSMNQIKDSWLASIL